MEGSDLLAAGLEAFQHHTTGRDGVGFQRNAPVFPVDPFAGVIVIGIGVRYVEGVSRGIEADLSDDIVTLGGCFVDVVGDFCVKIPVLVDKPGQPIFTGGSFPAHLVFRVQADVRNEGFHGNLAVFQGVFQGHDGVANLDIDLRKTAV